jgi:hypothetical protein
VFSLSSSPTGRRASLVKTLSGVFRRNSTAVIESEPVVEPEAAVQPEDMVKPDTKVALDDEIAPDVVAEPQSEAVKAN